MIKFKLICKIAGNNELHIIKNYEYLCPSGLQLRSSKLELEPPRKKYDILISDKGQILWAKQELRAIITQILTGTQLIINLNPHSQQKFGFAQQIVYFYFSICSTKIFYVFHSSFMTQFSTYEEFQSIKCQCE